MRILVLGASGMLGHKILLKLLNRYEVVGTLRKENETLTKLLRGNQNCVKYGIDAFDLDALKSYLTSFKPDLVINCIGIIKQHEEAKNPYISIAINAMFPHELEKLSEDLGFRTIHFSTDCVFSGKQGPYTETDPCDVSDVYGLTKYLGEIKGPNSLTLRTSIIGREITKPYTSLIEWYLSQEDKGAANGYVHALYTGVTTNYMVDMLEKFVNDPAFKELRGLYHLSADPISKHDLLNLVKEEAGMTLNLNPFEEFHCDRRLDSSALRTKTGWRPLAWKDMIHTMFEEDKTLYAALENS